LPLLLLHKAARCWLVVIQVKGFHWVASISWSLLLRFQNIVAN
jgi:hypothetical protein